ncbi:MAG: CBS domain-containing protein [Candidatus Marinimicrobia bacterium]|nr:CBS domain-containing protein [Candidatus Neomarinimicrobiota bacterium]
MYDINDDELKEMYENRGKSEVKLGKGISPTDPLSSLTQEKFIVLDEQATLREVIDNLQRYHIGCVLLERDDKISGIFTERDIVQNIVGNRHNLEEARIIDFMTKSPDTLHRDDPIAFALNKMISGGFRHIPIVDVKNKPTGVIAMQDIINHLGDYFFDDIVNLPPKPLRDQTQREGG